ncbi:MAG: TrmJ/YjtD family RNA methyltransferase [Spirochaetales bacterium]|nr:TrmJ/YjtD family RNA methyltransferase [Spirochaetales bacterium]
MHDLFDKIQVILVHPRSSRNIGAVCRAMKTMNIHTLSIIKGGTIDPVEVKHLAVHAYDIFEKATVYDNLEDALPDVSLIAGISRRRGKKRKYFAITPEELAEKIAQNSGKTALVFGNEESGLTEKELSYCHLAVKIPSSPLFPSLNLSHAVQIITYQVFRALSKSAFPLYTPINHAQLTSLTGIIIKSLKNIGFFSRGDPEELSLFFKDILGRSQLSGREARRLEVIFRKISGLIAKKGIKS